MIFQIFSARQKDITNYSCNESPCIMAIRAIRAKKAMIAKMAFMTIMAIMVFLTPSLTHITRFRHGRLFFRLFPLMSVR